MKWERKYFKKSKVYVLTDEQGNYILKNNLAQIKYRKDAEKTYFGRPKLIEDIQQEEDPIIIGKEYIKNNEKKLKNKAIEKSKDIIPQNRKQIKLKNKTELHDFYKKISLEKQDNTFHIYTDGASLGNPGPAGAGVYITCAGFEKKLSIPLFHTTNNVAELTAVKIALEEIGFVDSKVIIYTDSQYSLGVLTKAYKANKNRELIKGIWNLIDKYKNIEIVKVSGHSGIIPNEIADKLATSAAKELKKNITKQITPFIYTNLLCLKKKLKY